MAFLHIFLLKNESLLYFNKTQVNYSSSFKLLLFFPHLIYTMLDDILTFTYDKQQCNGHAYGFRHVTRTVQTCTDADLIDVWDISLTQGDILRYFIIHPIYINDSRLNIRKISPYKANIIQRKYKLQPPKLP